MFDYFTEARKLAAQYREIYDAFVAVGFTEKEALHLLTSLMGMGPRG